jgi:hypothetical protein
MAVRCHAVAAVGLRAAEGGIVRTCLWSARAAVGLTAAAPARAAAPAEVGRAARPARQHASAPVALPSAVDAFRFVIVTRQRDAHAAVAEARADCHALSERRVRSASLRGPTAPALNGPTAAVARRSASDPEIGARHGRAYAAVARSRHDAFGGRSRPAAPHTACARAAAVDDAAASVAGRPALDPEIGARRRNAGALRSPLAELKAGAGTALRRESRSSDRQAARSTGCSERARSKHECQPANGPPNGSRHMLSRAAGPTPSKASE